MITIGLAGATGRMGQAIATELLGAEDLELIEAVTRTPDQGVVGHPSLVSVDSWSDAVVVDVILDVSLPIGTSAALDHAVKTVRPLVTGVTGLPDDLRDRIRDASETIPILATSNFSLGVAALLRLLPLLSAGLAYTDVAMVDVHHRDKQDAPSGTARALLETINLGRDEPHRIDESSIRSLRIGGNPGEHTITFASMGEEVTIGHRALTRVCFAAGALVAVRWILNQPPGLYAMTDVIP